MLSDNYNCTENRLNHLFEIEDRILTKYKTSAIIHNQYEGQLFFHITERITGINHRMMGSVKI